jgi:hypothetical protein
MFQSQRRQYRYTGSADGIATNGRSVMIRSHRCRRRCPHGGSPCFCILMVLLLLSPGLLAPGSRWMLLVIARRLIRSRPQDAGRPESGHPLQRPPSVYAKSRSYRELNDVAQGGSYICGMTVADPLKNRERTASTPGALPLVLRPPWMHTFGTAVHAARLGLPSASEYRPIERRRHEIKRRTVQLSRPANLAPCRGPQAQAAEAYALPSRRVGHRGQRPQHLPLLGRKGQQLPSGHACRERRRDSHTGKARTSRPET